jgi:hypothetical protein
LIRSIDERYKEDDRVGSTEDVCERQMVPRAKENVVTDIKISLNSITRPTANPSRNIRPKCGEQVRVYHFFRLLPAIWRDEV